MNEICETVPSQKGGIKIKVDRCTGRAVTQLWDDKHYLKSFSKHKQHAPQAHKPEVAKVVPQIKQQAK
ncbi:15361_t:CDS:2, partial [Dentiscutata heterogama]